ncbi:MAG: DedA family protein, partial [Quadrisphaera sp.]
GARYGRPWLEKRPPKVLAHLARAEAFYERFGPVALVVARFIPWARTFVPVLAGVSRMRYSQFLAATLAGALVWGAGLIVLGYFAATVPWLKTAAYAVAGTAVALSVVVPVVAAVRRRLARRRGAPGPGGEPDQDDDGDGRGAGQRPSSSTE